MTALSLHLPNALAKASSQVAKQLGISRVAFIRRALMHELEATQIQREQTAMIKAFNAMRKNKLHLRRMQQLDASFSDSLKEISNNDREEGEWWNKNV